MTLLFMDGFDHYLAEADITRKWTTQSGGAQISPTTGRRGGGCVRSTGTTNNWLLTKSFQSRSTWIIGFAVSISAFPTSTIIIASLLDTGAVQCDLRVNSTGTLSLTRNGTAVSGGTTAVALTAGGWDYVEFKVTISDAVAADSCQIRVNGALAATVTAGQDLKAGTNSTANQVRVGPHTNPSATYAMDDLYVCDTAGDVNADWLGDVRIEPFFPSGAGTCQQFSPSVGTDHVALVDETTPDTSDYLTGGAAGTKETFTIAPVGSLPSSNLIVAVQVNSYAKKSDAGGAAVRNIVRSGSSEAAGPAAALSTSYTYVSSIHELNPATGQPWLLSEVQAMQAGIEVVS